MYYVDNLWPYVRSDAQMWHEDDGRGSILSTKAPTGSGGIRTVDDPRTAKTARGAFLLMSAGPDGIFFSPEAPIGSPEYPYERLIERGVEVMDEFDDILLSGSAPYRRDAGVVESKSARRVR